MPSSGSAARIGLVLALLVAPLTSAAADKAPPDLVRDLESGAASLQRQSEDIRRNFTERSGLIGVGEARERYEDAVYLFLVKDYEAAATSFYILVQSRALGNMDLARDSEWYLAECLFELGNFRTAEEAYRSIAEKGAQHPYFPDAVRRLLEVYGIVGDTERFDRYYNDFIVTGKVPTSELISYTLAKSFYRRGEFNRAKGMFESLPATSPYYSRARYFLGVLMIREENFKQAIDEFLKVQAVVPSDPDQQQILELSQLALARLYHESGDFAQASVWYGKIPGSSPYYSEQLFESVWTFVKQANVVLPEAGKTTTLRQRQSPAEVAAAKVVSDKAKAEAREWWAAAYKQVAIFLDKYPEHRHAADLKLLQGHLQMKLESYEDARVAYERVIDEYTPLVARLSAVTGTEQLRRLLEGATGGESGLSERLPPFAMGMLLGNENVSRAATAWRTVEQQKAELEASERIVKDLELALSGGGGLLGGFVVARQEVDGLRGAALSMRDRLLDAEASWMRTRVPSTLRAELQQIQKERASVLASVTEIDASTNFSSDRTETFEDQVREVQQRAFRLSQVALEAKALASSTADQVSQSKLSVTDADAVRASIATEQRSLDGALGELETFQGEVVRQRVMRGVVAPVESGDDSRRVAIVARYDDLRRRLQGYRSNVTDPEAPDIYAQTDRVWAAVDALESSTEETSRLLASAEGREISAVRTRLAREAQRVVELRRDLVREAAEAETVAIRAVRTGIRDLESEFRADVLEADKGIVDVYWLRKTAVSDEMTALGREQALLLRELDDQFRIVRENLDR
ncbi:MAG: tetratricopeptide repeat protein [Pseudomonadota bacterium]|nr:tetratricopeptide repeat protein [Pseudomonadota bacterium]